MHLHIEHIHTYAYICHIWTHTYTLRYEPRETLHECHAYTCRTYIIHILCLKSCHYTYGYAPRRTRRECPQKCHHIHTSFIYIHIHTHINVRTARNPVRMPPRMPPGPWMPKASRASSYLNIFFSWHAAKQVGPARAPHTKAPVVSR